MLTLKLNPEIHESDVNEAYARVLPLAWALKEENLRPVNLDVPSVILVGLNVVRHLPSLREDLQELPRYKLAEVLLLPDYVLALFRAQANYLVVTTEVTPPRALVIRARQLRKLLLAEVQLLISRGLLVSGLLKDFARTRGHKDVAFDLGGLAHLFRSNWDRLQGKTGVQEHDVEEAGRLALTLIDAMARSEQENRQAELQSASIRKRIFVLFTEAYDQLRRGVLYVRWKDAGAEKLVPSLYRGRGNSNIVRKGVADAGSSGS